MEKSDRFTKAVNDAKEEVSKLPEGKREASRAWVMAGRVQRDGSDGRNSQISAKALSTRGKSKSA